MKPITQLQIFFVVILSITEARIVSLGYQDGTYVGSVIIGIVTLVIFLCIYGIAYEVLSSHK